MATEFVFLLDISNQEYLNYYSGMATSVHVQTSQGLSIRFPASALKPFVSHEGISGKFSIKFDAKNKLISLDKIASF